MRVPCKMSKPLACLRGRLIARESAVGCSLGYYRPTAAPDQCRYLQHHNNTETVAGVSSSLLTLSDHPRNRNKITCGGCDRTITAHIRPSVCNGCSTAYHPTCSGHSRDAANIVTNTGHWTCPRCIATTAPVSAQPLTSRFISEPKYHRCRQILRTLQWNVDGLSTKQHELRLWRAEEARKAKCEEFLADLEGNSDPGRAWNIIKSFWDSLHSTAFCEPQSTMTAQF